MPHVSLEGREYHYARVGAGVPLVLLHGFPFSGESFWPQLDQPLAGVDLIVPDHRGFGRSTPGQGPSTMEALADDALRLLTALGLPRALVGGVSMGGYAALAAARLDPARVQGLVLIDTQALADDAAGQARREATAVDVEQHGVAGLTAGMLPKLFGPHASPQVRARVEALMLAQSRVGTAAASRGMALRHDARELLSRFAGPTLVVVGEHDLITPPERARQMADLVAGSRLEVLEDAGHLAHLEQPARFAQVVESFVAALPR